MVLMLMLKIRRVKMKNEIIIIDGVECIKDEKGWLMTKAVTDKIKAEFDKVFRNEPSCSKPTICIS